ncbi:cytochrome oxidase assembly protein ShyY1 [Motilibacter rhizosphaerae]|uniref:SURF1-like protein n=1 Tax=Motilibacter rhizosphaerae TaxID=598652 RepID=A0A4Q7NH49_9ACTN|nr:SURF1 family protein [Motilibacter rhizosphaerae]RZS82776.1 cytochrome oxidase assembly protein ShyY1 [Motilibacter rhizosphaerae]
MLRTLRQPRWIGLSLTVVLVSLLFARLGLWQWHRAQAKWAFNDAVAARSHAAPVDVGTLLQPGVRPPKRVEWRQVERTGTYDTARTVLRRNDTYDGNRGYTVIVPLVTPGQPALLVDRGFVPAPQTGGALALPSVPAAPSGTVTVRGLLRRPSSASLGLDRIGGATTVGHLVPDGIAAATGLGPVLDGYVQLVAEQPSAGTPLYTDDLPHQDVGLNLAYAVQWYAFILIAVAGWVVLLRREQAEEEAGAAGAPPATEPAREPQSS